MGHLSLLRACSHPRCPWLWRNESSETGNLGSVSKQNPSPLLCSTFPLSPETRFWETRFWEGYGYRVTLTKMSDDAQRTGRGLSRCQPWYNGMSRLRIAVLVQSLLASDGDERARRGLNRCLHWHDGMSRPGFAGLVQSLASDGDQSTGRGLNRCQHSYDGMSRLGFAVLFQSLAWDDDERTGRERKKHEAEWLLAF